MIFFSLGPCEEIPHTCSFTAVGRTNCGVFDIGRFNIELVIPGGVDDR